MGQFLAWSCTTLYALAWLDFHHFLDIFLVPHVFRFWCQLGSNLAPKIHLKSVQEPSKNNPKFDHFFDHLLDRFFVRFGANLSPTWLPKPSQNEAKLASKSHPRGKQPKCAKWARGLSESSIFEGSGLSSWSKNQTKITSKSYLKQDQILNGFWIALGSIFGRFWT